MAADGSIIIDTEISDKKAQAELDRLKKKIRSLNDQIYLKKQAQMPLVEQAEQLTVQLDAAKKKLNQLQQRFATANAAVARQKEVVKDLRTERKPLALNAAMTELNRLQNAAAAANKAVAEQKGTVKGLQAEYNGVQSRVESYQRSIDETTAKLNLNKEQAGALERQLASGSAAGRAMAQSMEDAQKGANKFRKRINSVVRSALVFTVISQALSKLRTWLGETVMANKEASAAVAKLKGALLTLAQPLLNVVIPAFTTFVNLLTRVVNAISTVVSAAFGTTAAESAKAAQALENQKNAMSGVGKAAKNAGKSLASFDEINKLGEEGSGSSGGSSSGISADFTGVVESSINDIYNVLMGAAAMLVLGAILVFTGASVNTGLFLMGAGALILFGAVKENWDAMDSPVKTALTKILALMGTFTLVLGLILALSGLNIPLGISLIAIGAAELFSDIGMNWDALKTLLQGELGGVVAFVGVTLIVIGILLLSNHMTIPLGISLVAAGAAAVFTVGALNWESIKTFLREHIDTILVFAGITLLVIGVIVALFAPGGMALGIALMAAGAVALGIKAGMDWNSFTKTVDGQMSKLSKILIGVGSALLALGVALCFAGQIPVGIALMVAGGTAIYGAIAPDWDKLSGPLINKIKSVITWVTNLREKVLNAITALKDMFKVGSSENQKMIMRNTPGLSTQTMRSSAPPLKMADVPHLATGAVIPPNRQFMAVLGDQKTGTNIETPESLLREIYRNETSGNTQLLQQILDALLSGQVMMVNNQVLAKVVRTATANAARSSGTSAIPV